MRATIGQRIRYVSPLGKETMKVASKRTLEVLALGYTKAGRIDDLLPLCASSPRIRRLVVVESLAQIARGSTTGPIQVLDALESDVPESVLRRAAHRLLKAGCVNDAIGLYRRVRDELPVEMIREIGRRLLCSGDYHQGVQAFAAIGRPVPRSLLRVCGKRLLEGGALTAALDVYRVAGNRPPKLAVRRCAADLLRAGYLEAGIEAFHAIDEAPDRHLLITCGDQALAVGADETALQAYALAQRTRRRFVLTRGRRRRGSRTVAFRNSRAKSRDQHPR